MSHKTFFNAKFAVSFFAVALFAIAFVTAGCSSSDTGEEEVTEETVEVEIQETPAADMTEAESSPAPAPTRKSGPPQELIDACNGLSEGDDCSVTISSGEFNGSCKALRSGNLACMPKPKPGKTGQNPTGD